MMITIYSVECTIKPLYNNHPRDLKKAVVVERWSFLEIMLLVKILFGHDSGWLLLTGGHYSGVVVSTGLTVGMKLKTI
jgi:hypothetical protein